MTATRKIRREFSNYVRDAVVNRVAFTSVVPDSLRDGILRFLGYNVGKSRICYGGYFGGRSVTIGANCYLARHVYVDASARVRIGDGVQIGPFVRLLTSTHDIGTAACRAGTARAEPVDIGDGVWIGAAAVILPGVSIGPGAVVAAGAVVTRDCAPNTLYAGVPARALRSL